MTSSDLGNPEVNDGMKLGSHYVIQDIDFFFKCHTYLIIVFDRIKFFAGNLLKEHFGPINFKSW